MPINPVWQGAILARPAILNSSTFQLVLAKPPLSFLLGFGIVFNFKIQSGRAASFIVCQCGRS